MTQPQKFSFLRRNGCNLGKADRSPNAGQQLYPWQDEAPDSVYVCPIRGKLDGPPAENVKLSSPESYLKMVRAITRFPETDTFKESRPKELQDFFDFIKNSKSDGEALKAIEAYQSKYVEDALKRGTVIVRQFSKDEYESRLASSAAVTVSPSPGLSPRPSVSP